MNMNILLFYKEKEQELHKRFKETKELAIEKERQLAELQEELVRLQGAFKLLETLIEEARKEEDDKKD